LKPISETRQSQPETLLTKENLWNEKAELENLLIENQTQTQFEKMPPLKRDFEFLNSTIKQTCESKAYLFLLLGCPTACVTCVWAGVDKVWEQEKLQARKILENAAESHTSGARFVRRIL